MKIDSLKIKKMIYNISIGSQHMDVLGAVGGSVDRGLEVVAMDRLNKKVSLAGNKCTMSAQAKDWYAAHFADCAGSANNNLVHRPHFFL